jgi:hypothetical protein
MMAPQELSVFNSLPPTPTMQGEAKPSVRHRHNADWPLHGYVVEALGSRRER